MLAESSKKGTSAAKFEGGARFSSIIEFSLRTEYWNTVIKRQRNHTTGDRPGL